MTSKDLLDQKVSQLDTSAVDLDQVWVEVAEWLAANLLRLANVAVLYRLRELRQAGALRGADGRDRFQDFINQLSSRAGLTDLLHRFPVLARLIAVRCRTVVDAVTELLRRLAEDRDRITDRLFSGRVPGKLVSVRLGRGDAHAAGRSVTMLRFSCGASLIYKPRPVDLHERWNDLLAWFGVVAPDLACRTAAVLARPGYGWVEFIPVLPCHDPTEVDLFYRRSGVLLALLHALNGTDVHCENLIASGSHPVLVDVETLLHPTWPVCADLGDDPARTVLGRSVLRTAFLRCSVAGPDGDVDVSAVGGHAQPEPAEPAWTDAGTDRMRPARPRIANAAGDNRPTLAKTVPNPAGHRQHLLAGFRAAYRLLAGHATDLTRLLSRFAGTELRLIGRGSQAYAEAMIDALHPDRLRGAEARVESFATLSGTPGQPHLAALEVAELRQLFDGDVPMFTAPADGRDVRSACGLVLPDLLRHSGLAAAAAKIAGLGDTDLATQDWVIRALLPPAPGRRDRRVRHLATGVGTIGERSLRLAVAIGDELVAGAHHGSGRVNWLGVEPESVTRWTVRAMGASLADGYSGVALFLAQLGKVTGTPAYLELAAAAAAPLPRLVTILAGQPDLAAEVGADGHHGLGGICYAIARLAVLLDDSRLAACVPHAVRATELAAGSAPAAGLRAALRAVRLEVGSPDAAGLLARLSGAEQPGEDRVAEQPRPDHSLGSGKLGALDSAVERAGAGDPAAAAAVSALAARTLDSIDRYGPRCATPGSVPTPGLITGTAGIGYGLLRVAFPDRVPSVLRLHPGAKPAENPATTTKWRTG